MKVNGCPLDLLEPEVLRVKAFEPILILGQERFADLDIRIRVKGEGKRMERELICLMLNAVGFFW